MGFSARNQLHPYPVEIVDDAGIIQRVVPLDQLQCFLDAAQGGKRFGFRGSDPKAVDFSAF